MHTALRPYATAGVALTGAALIAATPVVTPLPTIHMPEIELTALADVDLIGPWFDVFDGAMTNVSQIAGDMLEFPLPALAQLGSNWLGYGDNLVTALGATGGALIQALTETLPAALQDAFGALTAGNIAEAYALLAPTVLISGALPLAFPLVSIMESLTDITQNLANVTVNTGGTAIGLATASLGALMAPGAALADSGQLFVDALGVGDPLAALGALLNAPAAFTGGLLNGFASAFPDGLWTPGLLSSIDSGMEGPLSGLLVELPRAIAEGLGWDGLTGPFDGLLDAAGGLGGLLDFDFLTSGLSLDFLTDGLSGLLSFDGLAGLFDFGNLFDILNPMNFINMIMGLFIP